LLKTPIDHRSDLYSLGVTFYQLLAGRLPFDGGTASALVDQHVHAKEIPLVELESTRLPVCEALSAIVGKLMSKQASERYQSAFGVAADLNRCRIGMYLIALLVSKFQHDDIVLNDMKLVTATPSNPEAAPLESASAATIELIRNASLPREFSFTPLGLDDVVCILPISSTR
jgi:serine/threonine protein kinase